MFIRSGNLTRIYRQKNFRFTAQLADLVADMEVDKVADKVADMVADMFADIGYPSSSCQIGPKQTFPTQSLPDLRVF